MKKKKKFPIPLQIECDGWSAGAIKDLADRLRVCFYDVTIWGNEITAANPVNQDRYISAWRILDHYGVKVIY